VLQTTTIAEPDVVKRPHETMAHSKLSIYKLTARRDMDLRSSLLIFRKTDSMPAFNVGQTQQ